MTKQFKTKCTHCGEVGELFVTKVTVVESGKKLEINTALRPDGFEFDPNDDLIRSASTEDEEVTCRACMTVIPLSELTN